MVRLAVGATIMVVLLFGCAATPPASSPPTSSTPPSSESPRATVIEALGSATATATASTDHLLRANRAYIGPDLAPMPPLSIDAYESQVPAGPVSYELRADLSADYGCVSQVGDGYTSTRDTIRKSSPSIRASENAPAIGEVKVTMTLDLPKQPRLVCPRGSRAQLVSWVATGITVTDLVTGRSVRLSDLGGSELPSGSG